MKASDLTFLHGGQMSECTALVDKRFKGYYTLQFMEQGGVELFYDETRYLLEGGWFWPAFPGPLIRFHVAPGRTWNHRYIAFKGPLVNQWLADGLYPIAPQAVSDPEVEAERFDEMLRHFQSFDKWSRFKTLNILERILIDLAEARRESRISELWMEKALELLNGASEFALDYSALAKDCGMSLSTLRRKFRRVVGVPIHRYILQSRIARAMHLLDESDLSIKAIAEDLGYSDVYFFSRQFKKETGSSPSVFRNSRQV